MMHKKNLMLLGSLALLCAPVAAIAGPADSFMQGVQKCASVGQARCDEERLALYNKESAEILNGGKGWGIDPWAYRLGLGQCLTDYNRCVNRTDDYRAVTDDYLRKNYAKNHTDGDAASGSVAANAQPKRVPQLAPEDNSTQRQPTAQRREVASSSVSAERVSASTERVSTTRETPSASGGDFERRLIEAIRTNATALLEKDPRQRTFLKETTGYSYDDKESMKIVQTIDGYRVMFDGKLGEMLSKWWSQLSPGDRVWMLGVTKDASGNVKPDIPVAGRVVERPRNGMVKLEITRRKVNTTYVKTSGHWDVNTFQLMLCLQRSLPALAPTCESIAKTWIPDDYDSRDLVTETKSVETVKLRNVFPFDQVLEQHNVAKNAEGLKWFFAWIGQFVTWLQFDPNGGFFAKYTPR